MVQILYAKFKFVGYPRARMVVRAKEEKQVWKESYFDLKIIDELEEQYLLKAVESFISESKHTAKVFEQSLKDSFEVFRLDLKFINNFQVSCFFGFSSESPITSTN
jgi:hypothetical protein